MAVAAVLGATAVLFTWYGVNFLLGSGMHSYGSGAGGQWQVGTAVAIQWFFSPPPASDIECRKRMKNESEASKWERVRVRAGS